MNKPFSREYWVRVLLLLLGLAIAHLGVTLFLLTELGSDPFNVLIQGLHRLIGSTRITHGTVHICICFLIILILLFVDRSYIGIGTIICMFCGGPIIDFFTGLLSPFLGSSSSLALRLCMLVAGCVVLAFGMTMVIRSDAGTGPNDLVALVISEKTGWKFSLVRMAVDALFVLAGFLLGGVAGLGTLICMFLVGPVAGFFLPRNGRWIEKLVRRCCP